MIDFPKWFAGHVINIECPQCNRNLEIKNIITVGIKQYKFGKGRNKEDKYLFIEHTCDYCKKTYGFDIAICSLKDFVFDLVSQYTEEEGGYSQSEHILFGIDSEEKHPDSPEIKKKTKSEHSMSYFIAQITDDSEWKDIKKNYKK